MLAGMVLGGSSQETAANSWKTKVWHGTHVEDNVRSSLSLDYCWRQQLCHSPTKCALQPVSETREPGRSRPTSARYFIGHLRQHHKIAGVKVHSIQGQSRQTHRGHEINRVSDPKFEKPFEKEKKIVKNRRS